MLKKQTLSKKFEESLDNDICNFNPYTSDRSDKNQSQSASINTNMTHQNQTKKSRKNSKLSTKDSHSLNGSMNVSVNNNNQYSGNIFELIDSLKEKLNFYENEIKNLIDEKVQMQMTINNLQLANFNSLKKSKVGKSPSRLSAASDNLNTSNNNSDNLIKSNESAFELNKHYIKEASGLNRELKNLQSHIEKQKLLLEENDSILEETIMEYDKEDAPFNNTNLTTIAQNKSSNATLIFEGNKNEIKSKESNNDINNLNAQREMIVNEIKILREEMFSLLELQKNLANEVQSSSKRNLNEPESSQVDISTHSVNNSQTLIKNNKQETDPDENTIVDIHSSKTNSDNLTPKKSPFLVTDNLPNIEQFFVFNNKFSLVDSDKNLWHLKKCRKFEEFSSTSNFNSKDENLMAFLDFYQNLPKNKTEEVKDEEKLNEDNTNNSNINIDEQKLKYQNIPTQYTDKIRITDYEEIENNNSINKKEDDNIVITDFEQEGELDNHNHENSYILSDSN